MNKENKSGVVVLVVLVAIIFIAFVAGGISYFIGYSQSKTPAASTTQIAQNPGGQEEEEIAKELDNTVLGSIDSDLKDIDREVASY